jgi:outer membrane protein OmpA-like peptidoglycan-associated protein
MQPFFFTRKSLFFCLGVLVASCNPKAKTEEVSSPPMDSAKHPVEQVIEPTKKDSVAIAEPEKKATPAVTPQKQVQQTIKVEIKKSQKKTETEKKPLTEPTPAKETIAETPPTKEIVVETPPVKELVKTETPKADTTTAIKQNTDVSKTKGKPYYFKVLRKEDGKEIFGDLQLQEAIGAKQYQLVKSGEIIYLEAPKNKRGSYNLVALLPGYKEASLIFLYNNPPIETGPKNEEIITLVLDKAKSGDYVDFNNVHFFKNASILRPASKNELDQLVFLLKDNPRYKIRIHGHCNGTQDRESYLMGTSTDFFAMNPKGNKKITISAKDLSQARAETVRDYLVQQGIDPERIAVKAEGGKMPMYPESGTLGQYNDRVEVEFTKH